MKRLAGVNLTTGSTIAAIDMGSNSFHLLIAERAEAGPSSAYRAEYRTERKVQLAAGSEHGVLQADAQARALACLAEFKEILAAYRPVILRIVATASLRGVANAADFCEQVMYLLGVEPEIISGEREAELVYLGVAAPGDIGQLVVDIGGGSTELALGRGQVLGQGLSVAVGCLSYLRYFPAGRLQRTDFDAATAAARAEFELAAASLSKPSRLQFIGCSGTLLAVEQVLMARNGGGRGIRLAELQELATDLQSFASLGAISYQGLTEDRQSIFASGVAIVLALFGALNIEEMQLSEQGLREGVVKSYLLAASAD